MNDGHPARPDLPDLIRRAYTPDDLPEVVALHIRAFSLLAGGTHSTEQIAGHTALVRGPGYGADLARCTMSLAFTRGRLIGTAGWLPLDDDPVLARIRKVFVSPALARRGLASWLVASAEREASDAGRPTYVVRANLNAVPLYRRLGYRAVETGTMDTPTGVALPVLFMRKDARAP